MPFTSHYSTPHHIKRFHITHHSITSHQKILHRTTFHITPFHTTPFHVTPPLHNIPHHITTYRMFHATSLTETFNVATSHLGPPYSTSDITLHQSLPPTTISHHHISKHNIFDITQPQSTSHHSRSTNIPHHTHIQHHSTFHTTPYSTSHITSS